MSHPRVFNVHSGHPGVYVARKKVGMHYGNPFTHKHGTLAAVVVESIPEAVQAYRDWLDGEAWYDIEQERRLWILDHLAELIDQDLLCFCAPLTPDPSKKWLCHADILAEKAEALKQKQIGEQNVNQE